MCYWYKNRIHIFGDAKKMEKVLKKALVNGQTEDHEPEWLGALVIGTGIGTVGEGLPSDVDCRGKIIGMQAQENKLMLMTQTAESPNVSLFRKIFPENDIIYSSIGADGYAESNDLENVGRYLFHTVYRNDKVRRLGEFDNWNFLPENEARETAQRILGSTEDDLLELQKMISHAFNGALELTRIEAGSADQLDGEVEFEIS